MAETLGPGDTRPGAASEWRQNWKVVLAAAFGMGLLSVPTYSMGIFMKPIEDTFGWSRAAISASHLFGSITGIVLAPLIGLLVDHSGPKRLALTGSILVCLLFGMLALTGQNILIWWGLWALLALAGMLIKPTTWTAGVSSLFTAGRGLALAVTLSGTVLASTLTPILGTYLIGQYGWRVAYVALAAIWAAFALPLIIFFFDSAHDQHRLGQSAAKAPQAPLEGVTAREGLLSWRFVKLALGAFIATLIAASFVSTLVPILISVGQTPTTAAAIASAMGLTTVAGRLVSGFLVDKINANLIAAATLLLPIVASLFLLFKSDSILATTAAAILLGFTLGAKLHFVAYLTTRHFGMRSFGVLFGTIAGLFGLATGVGPIFLNLAYDRLGTYDMGLIAIVPLALIASFLFLLLGPYPEFPGQKQASAAM